MKTKRRSREGGKKHWRNRPKLKPEENLIQGTEGNALNLHRCIKDQRKLVNILYKNRIVSTKKNGITE